MLSRAPAAVLPSLPPPKLAGALFSSAECTPPRVIARSSLPPPVARGGRAPSLNSWRSVRSSARRRTSAILFMAQHAVAFVRFFICRNSYGNY